MVDDIIEKSLIEVWKLIQQIQKQLHLWVTFELGHHVLHGICKGTLYHGHTSSVKNNLMIHTSVICNLSDFTLSKKMLLFNMCLSK